jgi:spermidine/putrescine transport system ATP-binding protein
MALTAELAPSAAAPGPAPVADPIIRVDRVSKRYGDLSIIENLNLDVERGEFLTLLGPSGCGKTTTLKMIAGFETPSEGRILLDGRDITHAPPYRRPLNTVFQQYALFPHMTVFDNVAFGPRTAGRDRQEVERAVEAALATVSMGQMAWKKPDQLSGGQQQRVALARALVNKPKALLLDEPLSALDVKLRRAMQLELKRIQGEVDTTFIFVTHDQEEALTMSCRIAVMNAGRIEQLDEPETIYRRPSTRFVAGFIGHANLLPATVVEAAGGEALLEVAAGERVRSAAPANTRSGDKVLLVLRPEQVSLTTTAPAGDQAALRATLQTVDFQGPTVRYALARDAAAELIVTVPPHHHLAGVEPGQTLYVHWEPVHAWIVPEAAGGA